jgi:hypothetical protein
MELFEIPDTGRRIDHLPCESILCFAELSESNNEISLLKCGQPVVVAAT